MVHFFKHLLKVNFNALYFCRDFVIWPRYNVLYYYLIKIYKNAYICIFNLDFAYCNSKCPSPAQNCPRSNILTVYNLFIGINICKLIKNKDI